MKDDCHRARVRCKLRTFQFVSRYLRTISRQIVRMCPIMISIVITILPPDYE